MREFNVTTKAVKTNIAGRPVIRYNEMEKLTTQLGFLEDNTELKVTIELYNERREQNKLRTDAQNKYYHLLLDIICNYTGDVSHVDMHRKLARKFLGIPYIEEDKTYIEVPSTTGLSPKKFGEYLEKVFMWASEEHSLVLPESSKYY